MAEFILETDDPSQTYLDKGGIVRPIRFNSSVYKYGKAACHPFGGTIRLVCLDKRKIK